MLYASRSFCVSWKSIRPLNCWDVCWFGEVVCKNTTSATLSKPPPRNGECVPIGTPVTGLPISRPCPGMKLQLTPCTSPMLGQSCAPTPLCSRMVAFAGEMPGMPRNFEAILPVGAALYKLEVSNHPVVGLVDLLRTVSYAKKKNSLFFQMGPPTLPPI